MNSIHLRIRVEQKCEISAVGGVDVDGDHVGHG